MGLKLNPTCSFTVRAADPNHAVSAHERQHQHSLIALQIAAFLVLGTAQFLHLGIPTFGSPPHQHGIFQSYFDYVHVSLNYIITAVGQAVLLVVCLVVDRGDTHGEMAL